MDDQDRLDRIEQKLDELTRRLDQAGKGTPPTDIHIETDRRIRRRDGSRFFWGIVFMLGGLLWMGNRLDWFDVHLPIAAMGLIAIGIYLILTPRR